LPSLQFIASLLFLILPGDIAATTLAMLSLSNFDHVVSNVAKTSLEVHFESNTIYSVTLTEAWNRLQGRVSITFDYCMKK